MESRELIVNDAPIKAPEAHTGGRLWPFLLGSLLVHLFILGIGGLLFKTYEPVKGTIEVRMVSLVSRPQTPDPRTQNPEPRPQPPVMVHGEESKSFKETIPFPVAIAEESVRPQTSDPRPQTPDPRPQTSDLRPQTSDPRPQHLPFPIESMGAREGLEAPVISPNLDRRHGTGDLSSLQSPASRLQPPGLVIPDSVGEGKGGTSPLIPLDEIRQRIERAKFYPAWARRQGIEGTVVLEFLLSRNGEVKEVRVLQSSGSSILDEASVETVKKGAPYPAVVGRIQLPITYRLEE